MLARIINVAQIVTEGMTRKIRMLYLKKSGILLDVVLTVHHR